MLLKMSYFQMIAPKLWTFKLRLLALKKIPIKNDGITEENQQNKKLQGIDGIL